MPSGERESSRSRSPRRDDSGPPVLTRRATQRDYPAHSHSGIVKTVTAKEAVNHIEDSLYTGLFTIAHINPDLNTRNQVWLIACTILVVQLVAPGLLLMSSELEDLRVLVVEGNDEFSLFPLVRAKCRRRGNWQQRVMIGIVAMLYVGKLLTRRVCVEKLLQRTRVREPTIQVTKASTGATDSSADPGDGAVQTCLSGPVHIDSRTLDQDRRFGCISPEFYLCGCIDLFMETVYEAFVYIVNLVLCYEAENLTDIVFNALALEFVVRLDNEFKQIFFDVYVDKENDDDMMGIIKRKYVKLSQDCGSPDQGRLMRRKFTAWCTWSMPVAIWMCAMILMFGGLCR